MGGKVNFGLLVEICACNAERERRQYDENCRKEESDENLSKPRIRRIRSARSHDNQDSDDAEND